VEIPPGLVPAAAGAWVDRLPAEAIGKSEAGRAVLPARATANGDEVGKGFSM
jgi:hypothetical protein